MMAVPPSQGYKKLLHDFSNIQGSSEALDDPQDNDYYDESDAEEEEDDNSNHQESQEVQMVLDKMKI